MPAAAQAAATPVATGPTVSLISLAAGRATKYAWTVETATYPSGLSIKVGTYVGNLVISSNFTRSAAGSVGIVSGSLRVSNPAEFSLQLSAVQVLVQQPTAGQAPFRRIAECPRNQEGYVVVDAQQAIICPFAVQLPGSSNAPVAVQGQAVVLGGGQLASPASMAVFGNAASSSSSTSSTGSSSAAADVELGKCAMVSDTFMSGQLYLAPGSVAAGSSMPALGGALAVCGTMRSLYRVAFGPYGAGVACGTYKVVRTARVNPLGGEQPPATASSLVLVSITGCSSPVPPAPPPPPPRVPVPTPAPSSSLPPATQSVIFGPPAPPSPVYVPAPVAPAPAPQYYTPAPVPQYYTPAATPPVAPTPAAPTPAPAAGEYYYTYEYEATVPTGRRRRGRRRLQEQQELHAGSSSSSYSSSGIGGSDGAGSSDSAELTGSSSSSDVEGSSSDDPGGLRGAWLDTGLAWLPQQEQGHENLTYQQQQQQHALPNGSQAPLLQASLQQHHQQQLEHSLPGFAGTQQHTAAVAQAGLDLQQLQEALQTGYGLNQGLPAMDSSVLGSALVFPAADTADEQQQQREARGDDEQQQQQLEQEGEQQVLSAEQQLRQYGAALDDQQLLVNADSREQRWQVRRMRRRLQQSAAAPQPGSGATYYGATATAAGSSSPSIAFGPVQVDSTVLSFAWQPKASVTPAALSLQVGNTATLQYSVKVLRTQLPNRVLLRGSLLLRNPLGSPLSFGEVAVEAPAAGQPAWGYSSATCGTPGSSSSSASAASIASVLASSITVPAKGQLVCSFVLSYPANAPAQGVVFARAVTDAGKELISAPFSFTRPAAAAPAAQAAKLGACALVSDTFMTATENPAVLAPSKVPASGTKAPEAAAAALGAGSSKGGVLLCNSAAYAYTATLGPYTAGQCGRFKVVNFVRVHPLNGSIMAPASQSSSATVDITGCSPLGGLAAANPLSAAAISAATSAYSQLGASGAKLALPVVTLPPLEIRQVTSYAWSVINMPITPVVKLQYRQVFRAAFMVQFKRSAAPPGATISGVLTVRNPNLLDPILLAQAQVELSMPGGTGPSARAWANCPRDASEYASVSGQLLGSGTLECSWSMELLAAGPYGALIAAGSTAQLVAVVTTSTGREAASAAAPLSSVPAGARNGKPAGACAALTNAFQMVGPGGAQLLLPSAAGKASSSDLLPGQAGGGRAADVVCDSLSVSYGATYGPLTDKQCGTYQTINVAMASPTTGQGDLAAAAAGTVMEFSGCPGAAASMNITALQLQMLKATYWNITGQIAAGSSIKVSVGSTLDVSFGLRYTATAAPGVRQMVGAVSVRSVGKAALQVSQLLLDVTPLDAAAAAQGSLVTWGATCPGGSNSGGISSVPANSSISCTFTGYVPASLTGAASVVARLQLADGAEAASPAALFDFTKAPTFVVTKGRCAVIADQFLSGAGLLQPARTSRPAAAAAARQVCNSQSVSFVASLGPFTKAQCGKQLAVVNLARVSPVSTSAIQLPISAATILGVNVTGGCGKGS